MTGVNADRLRRLTLELLEVESPTGDTGDAARLYARRLEKAGLTVELLEAFEDHASARGEAAAEQARLRRESQERPASMPHAEDA